jgi:hypothetical protein
MYVQYYTVPTYIKVAGHAGCPWMLFKAPFSSFHRSSIIIIHRDITTARWHFPHLIVRDIIAARWQFSSSHRSRAAHWHFPHLIVQDIITARWQFSSSHRLRAARWYFPHLIIQDIIVALRELYFN